MIGLSKKWISFLWLLSPIQIEWGSSRIGGDSPPMCSLICTCRRSLQNIRQESWTPSLVSSVGSNLTCTSLCVGIVYPSWWPFHSVCSECGKTCHWRWLHIHDRTMFQWKAGPYWALGKDVLFVLEATGLGETGVLCALTWWFPCLSFGWGADGQPIVYCRMASWESVNAPSYPVSATDRLSIVFTSLGLDWM